MQEEENRRSSRKTEEKYRMEGERGRGRKVEIGGDRGRGRKKRKEIGKKKCEEVRMKGCTVITFSFSLSFTCRLPYLLPAQCWESAIDGVDLDF